MIGFQKLGTCDFFPCQLLLLPNLRGLLKDTDGLHNPLLFLGGNVALVVGYGTRKFPGVTSVTV